MLQEEMPHDASSSVLQRDNYSVSDYASLEAALAHVVSNVEVTESDSLMGVMHRFHSQLADPSGKMLNNSNMSALCVTYETFLPRVGLNGIAQAVGELPYPKGCACTCALTSSLTLSFTTDGCQKADDYPCRYDEPCACRLDDALHVRLGRAVRDTAWS